MDSAKAATKRFSMGDLSAQARGERCGGRRGGNRIESAGAPGVAPQQAARRERASLEHAVDLDGLGRVLRARRSGNGRPARQEGRHARACSARKLPATTRAGLHAPKPVDAARAGARPDRPRADRRAVRARLIFTLTTRSTGEAVDRPVLAEDLADDALDPIARDGSDRTSWLR